MSLTSSSVVVAVVVFNNDHDDDDSNDTIHNDNDTCSKKYKAYLFLLSASAKTYDLFLWSTGRGGERNKLKYTKTQDDMTAKSNLPSSVGANL